MVTVVLEPAKRVALVGVAESENVGTAEVDVR